MAKTFEELECWQVAIDLDSEVYDLVNGVKIRTLFSLRDQMLAPPL